MNIAEQIKAMQATRAAKAAEMENIMQKSIDEGRGMEDDEAERFDELDTEIKRLDEDLARLGRMEKLQVQRSAAILPTGNDREGTQQRNAPAGQRAPMIITSKSDKDDDFKGQAYVRRIIARTLSQLDGVSAVAIAQHRWGKSNPQLVEVIKADVAGGGSGSGEWGAELVDADSRYMGDFVEYLYSRTIFDQLPLRQVPANVTIKGQDGAATGYWVGESKAIAVSKVDFSAVSLTPLKVAALAVMSLELMRDSSPAAEMLVRDALVEASAQRIDGTFLSASAAVAGVSPAGILNGVTAITSNGITEPDVLADIEALMNPFITAKNSSGTGFVLNSGLALKLQLMRNALGVRSFPDMRETGGTLEGKTAATGDNVDPNQLILLKPSDIWRIGDSGVRVELSRDATIEMSNTPTGASDTPADMSSPRVSMFQTDSVALKVVRSINWQKRRSDAVQYIGDADYGAGAS